MLDHSVEDLDKYNYLKSRSQSNIDLYGWIYALESKLSLDLPLQYS